MEAHKHKASVFFDLQVIVQLTVFRYLTGNVVTMSQILRNMRQTFDLCLAPLLGKAPCRHER